MSKSEKIVEQYLVSRIKAIGGKSYKWRAVDHKGVPDRICILPWMGVFFVELKRLGKNPTALQLKTFEDIKRAGGIVFVARGKEGVDMLIKYVIDLNPDNEKLPTK